MRFLVATLSLAALVMAGCGGEEDSPPAPPDSEAAQTEAFGYASDRLRLSCEDPQRTYGAWLGEDTYRYVFKTKCKPGRGRPGRSIDGVGVRTLAVSYRRDESGTWAVAGVTDMTVWRRYPGG